MMLWPRFLIRSHFRVPKVVHWDMSPWVVLEAWFWKPKIAKYRQFSKEVYKVISTYAPIVEKASIDEWYVDLTNVQWNSVVQNGNSKRVDSNGKLRKVFKLVVDWLTNQGSPCKLSEAIRQTEIIVNGKRANCEKQTHKLIAFVRQFSTN